MRIKMCLKTKEVSSWAREEPCIGYVKQDKLISKKIQELGDYYFFFENEWLKQ